MTHPDVQHDLLSRLERLAEDLEYQAKRLGEAALSAADTDRRLELTEGSLRMLERAASLRSSIVQWRKAA